MDMDQDGYCQDVDCADHDPRVYPGAPEVVNQADDDCDTLIDEPEGYIPPLQSRARVVRGLISSS